MSLVDHNRAAVYGSTVDHGRWWPNGSPERGLRAAPVSGSSPAVRENEEETSGVPTVGEGGRCGAEGRPVTVNRNGGGLELNVGASGGMERRNREWDEVQWGAAVLGAPFTGPEEGAGRPDGEEDRAAGDGGINAGRPVRWGGETEGRVGSEEGECDAISGRGGDTGAVHAVSRGGRRSSGAHTAVRGEGGGGWAGRRPRPGGWAWGEGGGLREEEGSGPVAGHMGRAEKGKEAGSKPFLGLRSNKVKENHF
jgi:hypothetical protein